MAAAQQTDFALPALPDVSAKAQADFELPSLPTLQAPERRASQQGRVTRLFGFATRRAEAKLPTAQLPTPSAIATTEAKAEVTWSSRQSTGARWTVNPHVTTPQSPAGEVVAASAQVPTDETQSQEPHAITMTISGGESNESLIDVDIPLLLPSYADEPENAPEPTTPARQPEIVKKKTQIRLSDNTSPAPQAPLAPKPQPTEFSLSDSTRAKPFAPPKALAAPTDNLPTAPQLADMTPNAHMQAELPASPSVDAAQPSTTRHAPTQRVASLPKHLAEPKTESHLQPVKLPKAELPSTTTSRAVTGSLSDASRPTRKPMKVAIEGQPARVVDSSNASSMGSAPKLPQPTFETSRSNVANRYQSSRKSSTPPPRPIPARLASQSTPVPIKTDANESFESSRKSEKARQLPPEALAKMTRLSVVVEQAVPMSVRSSIVQTSVEDPSVCQLIQSGDRSLSLVGLKSGSTRVAIVTSQDGSEPKVRVYEVSVGRGAKAEYGLAELAAGIDETVTRLYPSSRIRVSAGEGHLVVSGTADTEEQARRVLALVRRTSLMPVTDQLRTR